MTYTKPDITTLGNACALIEQSSQKGSTQSDSQDTQAVSPAYDLDE